MADGSGGKNVLRWIPWDFARADFERLTRDRTPNAVLTAGEFWVTNLVGIRHRSCQTDLAPSVYPRRFASPDQLKIRAPGRPRCACGEAAVGPALPF